MEYVVVVGNGPLDLAKHVNAAIEKGWRPIGGVSFSGIVSFDADKEDDDGTAMFFQAVVRD